MYPQKYLFKQLKSIQFYCQMLEVAESKLRQNVGDFYPLVNQGEWK